MNLLCSIGNLSFSFPFSTYQNSQRHQLDGGMESKECYLIGNCYQSHSDWHLSVCRLGSFVARLVATIDHGYHNKINPPARSTISIGADGSRPDKPRALFCSPKPNDSTTGSLPDSIGPYAPGSMTHPVGGSSWLETIDGDGKKVPGGRWQPSCLITSKRTIASGAREKSQN